jgi:hypothetical protein
VRLAVPLLLKEMEPVLEADAPDVSEGVVDALVVLLPLSVDEGVMDAVPVPVFVGVEVGVPVGVREGVAVLLKDADPVLLADAPFVTDDVGVIVAVVEPLRVDEGVGGGVPVPDPVGEEVGVPVLVTLGVPVPLSELEPVLEADTPAVREGVGDALTVLLALMVEEGVLVAVPEPVLVGVTVGVPLPVGLAVTLPLKLALPLLDADAPDVSEGVDDELLVELPLSVVVAVTDAVPVPVLVGVTVGDPVGVSDDVVVALRLLLPVLLADTPAVSDGV